MSVNDPLGDMLTRIRNAQARGKSTVTTPASKLRAWVLDVLASEARWVWLPCLGLALTGITLRALYVRLSSTCRPPSRRASAP